MRWLIVITLLWSARVAASPSPSPSPYDVGWATFGFGLGASPELAGDLADRLEREPCGTTCPLSSRLALSVGLARYALELQVAASPLIDAGALDHRDRDRLAMRVGPLVRYTLVRRFGFDLSVRAGFQLGALSGESSTASMADPSCPVGREGMCPSIETTYDPDSYFLAALPLGATLRLGVRVPERGFAALFADFDCTLARISFPGDARTGAMRTVTYGFMFGSMFDLPR